MVSKFSGRVKRGYSEFFGSVEHGPEAVAGVKHWSG